MKDEKRVAGAAHDVFILHPSSFILDL